MQLNDLHKSRFGSSGIRPTIIDYTLSRARHLDQHLDQQKEQTEKAKDFTIIYDPFRITGIFTGQGKTAEEKSQRQTYRKMLAHAMAVEKESHAQDPSRQNKKADKWARFMPRTNAIWLSYLLSTLLSRSSYQILQNSSPVSKDAQVGIYQTMAETLEMLNGHDCNGSGGDRGNVSEVGRKAGQEVAPPLSLLPQSASDVVAIARRDGLLTEEDLVAIKESLERE